MTLPLIFMYTQRFINIPCTQMVTYGIHCYADTFPTYLETCFAFQWFHFLSGLAPFFSPLRSCIVLHCTMNLPDFIYPVVYSWTSRCLFWFYKLYYCECPYMSTCSHKWEFISRRNSWKWKGLGRRYCLGAS